MSNKTQADSQFQTFVKNFHRAFGILREEDVQTQQQEVLAEYVRLDALILFPLDFNFRLLMNCLFPFLGPFTVFEYKSQRDKLLVAHVYQYSLTELGLVVTRYLSEKRQDRSEWKSLSQKTASAKWKQLSAQGAHHSCCTVILSTTDPKRLRKKVGFEAVEAYPHLKGALYRKVILEDEFVGSIATYIVVLNDLPICPVNAPLLLLSTKKKKIEFCKWLLSEIEGVTLEEKRYYQLYLLENHLIQNEEVEREMRHDFFGPPDHNWIFDEFEERSPDEQERFRQLFYKRMLRADSPQEVAQRALEALEAAQKLLKSEEERRAMMAYLQQMVSTTASPSASAGA